MCIECYAFAGSSCILVFKVNRIVASGMTSFQFKLLRENMNLIIGCLCNLCYHSSLKQWSLCWSEKKTHSPSNPCQTSTLLVCPTCSTVFLHYTFYFLFTSCYVLRCCLWVERHTVHALRLLLWPCNHGGNPQLGGAQNFYRERKNRLLCLSLSLSLSVSVSLSLSLCPCLSVSLSLSTHTRTYLSITYPVL